MAEILCSRLMFGLLGILNELGKQARIFIPEEVKKEIVVTEDPDKSEDDLSKWLKRSTIPIRKPTEKVIVCWQKILQADHHINF